MLTIAATAFADFLDQAFWWIAGISAVLLIGITAFMIFVVIRFRRSRHPDPVPREGNLPLEIVWIVIPMVIVLFMFFKGYEGFKFIRTVPKDAMPVKVLAQQWFWTFEYPDAGVTSNELYIPVGRPIRLLLTAPPKDVVHSFYLPAFRVKEDCVPGRENHMWIEAQKPGTFNVFCAEFCGKDHSKMLTLMHALPPDEYEAWLRKKIEDKNKPVTAEAALDPNSKEIKERDGKKLFETFCISCHGKEGQGGLVDAARNFTQLQGWKRSPKITDIYETLEQGIPGTQMRSFANLPPWDRLALAHYVHAFSASRNPPQSTLEEMKALIEKHKLGQKPEETKTIPIDEAMRLIEEGR